MRADRPDLHSAQSVSASVQRLRLIAMLGGYLTLVIVAWLTGSDLLSAICVILLISAVLAPRLKAGAQGPWLLWCGLVGGVAALTVAGHGRIALDLVPLAINLALAGLFGHTLMASHTPLIARAIVAIEGRERLALPRVMSYARSLTAAWTALFLLQAAAFAVVLFGWLPALSPADPRRTWLTTYLHVGGLLLPALFMLVEYVFRRWYLRHVPHVPPQVFVQRLVQNWPQLLRDSTARAASGARDVR